VAVVGAHLAGGLPLHDPAPPSAYADTAALRFLYEPPVLAALANTAWAERLLFGSDFPLVSQAAALADVRAAAWTARPGAPPRRERPRVAAAGRQ
jgi:predicted TIM-barrel fold metal-dependent hydrolase